MLNNYSDSRNNIFKLNNSEIIEITNLINEFRAIHKVQSLIYDSNLSEEAHNNAIKLIKSKRVNSYDNVTDTIKSLDNIHTNNIYSSWKCRNVKLINIKNGIRKWYHEMNYYNYDNYDINNTKKCFNFTALIWKSSTHFGIGYTYVNGKCVVCLIISQKGNILEEYNTNVLPIIN